ncbi:hypothetical protein V2V06_07290 [Paenibacillus polymyxa]|nr:hypothetical protein [Paenibacillus polymyxa]
MSLYLTMSKEEIITLLEDYVEKGDHLRGLITKLKDSREDDSALEELKREFTNTKLGLKQHYEALDKTKTQRNRNVESYLCPVIQGVYVNISGLSANNITRNKLEKVASAAFDLSDYAERYLLKLTQKS